MGYFMNTSSSGNFFMMNYLQGLQAYRMSNYNSSEAFTADTLTKLSQMGMVETSLVDFTLQHVMTGTWMDLVSVGIYELAPGVTLPGKKAQSFCQFVTHYMFKWIVGIDVCKGEDYSSLRYLCPE